jgi:arabinan endo-1,5-alpha-L-arabinosidase
MKRRWTGRRTRAALLAAALGLAALSGTATASLIPPLPTPPGVPTLPLPGSGSNPAPQKTVAPPRPSRSPPSLCSDVSAPGPVAFIDSVFPCDFADPMVLRVGGTWYAYASASGWEPGAAAFPILRSTDLRHWTAVGNALPRPPAWTAGDLWGPSVLHWHGRYLLFYNAAHGANGPHCRAVATAAIPQGPFRPQRRIACGRGRLQSFIDPAPLVVGRRLYLFFSVDFPQHSISVLRLSANGLRAVGPLHTVLPVSRRWSHLNSRTVEGPWPMRHDGRYYLFYSTGSWAADYRMSFARASAPLGPYTDSAPVALVGPRHGLPAPGGGSVFPGPHGSSWLAFAAWSGGLGYTLGSERTLRVAPLSWSAKGRPRLRLTGSS